MVDDRGARVAVYIDFDNVVISRYDSLHGHNAWRGDDARDRTPKQGGEEVEQRLDEATVDVGALLDYAASFGTLALTRAYADWSVPANAAYRRHLTDRAVDLVQLFPLGGTKNGADIRLAVDVVEDLTRYADITHVVVVAGDSDYVALAQRCKQLGRYVVGIGVAGSTGRALVAACDEFRTYDTLPDVKPPQPREPAQPAKKTTATKAAKKAAKPEQRQPEQKAPDPKRQAGKLLVRAVRIVAEKNDDEGWAHASTVKQQMVRMDPGFKEKELGFSSFRAFTEAYPSVIETRRSEQVLELRAR